MTTPLGRPSPDDASLTARLVRGDNGAFEQLVRLYQAPVARLAQRLLGWNSDVDDIVQDVFLTLFEGARTFRGESSPWTWLCQITINRCRSQQRREARRSQLRRLLQGPAPQATPADHILAAAEALQAVQAAVGSLPPRDREVVVLFYLENQSAEQIGRLVGSRVNTVHMRLHRARAKLRKMLTALIQDDAT